MLKKIVFSLSLLLSVLPLSAQVQSGLYPYGSFDNLGFDSIDRGSLNVHFSIPVVTKQGRGLGFQYQLVYDGLIWTPVIANGGATWTPATGWGLHGQVNEGFQGYLSYSTNNPKCIANGTTTFPPVYTQYVYHDQFGVSHPFSYSANYCTETFTGAGPSTDGSGYSFNGAIVTSNDGKQISAPVNNQTSGGTISDNNGNYITNNGNGTFTDTTGKTALTITGSGTASSPRVFTYSTLTGTANVTVTYKTYNVQTTFACAVNQYVLSQDLVNTITLADGSVYTFAYEPTPGVPSAVTARLSQLTLPQGGVINYTYTPSNGIECADGTPAGLTISGGPGRTYTRPTVTASTSQTNVTDGLGNSSTYNFVMAGAPEAFYETNRTVNQGASTALLSRQTCYNGATNPCSTTALTLPITQIDTYETLNGSEQHGSKVAYNTFGLKTSETDYDFSTNLTSHGSILRGETWAYPTEGIADLVSSDSVNDGNTLIGLTNYTYDETSGTGHAPLVTTSGLPNHTSAGQRGNLTTMTQYFNPSSYLTTTSAYQDTGNPVSVTTPNGTSTYSYDPATDAFLTTSTPPTPSSGVSLPSSATNDPNSGVPLTSVDPNSQTTTYVSYDPLLRPTTITYPDGGKLIVNYSANHVGIARYMNASTYADLETQLTSFGQLYWQAQTNGDGYYWNYYCYDNNGNRQFAAYRTTNNNNFLCSGAGDSYTYDALGRVLTVDHGDGTGKSFSYNGRATKMTDENGFSRIVQVDGLGRTTYVCEVTGTTLAGVAPAACNLDIAGTGFITSYVYNTDYSRANAQELTVTQGSQVRYFETDFLGRTTLVVEPETQVTTYSYSYSTTAGLGLIVNRVRPQANQTGSATTTTTTQYDSLGRIQEVVYSDGTPNRAYLYDVNAWQTPTANNQKGRLAVTGVSGSGSANWNGSLFSYDAMGRVVGLWACYPSTCGTANQTARSLSFAYDWNGNLTQESDTVSGTITYGRSVAGEVTSITNETYQNMPYNPENLASNVVNGPFGPVSYTLGNGLNVDRTYDQLGRLAGVFVCNGPAAASCSGGTQVYGTATARVGANVLHQSDTVLNQQVTFGYGDGLNRLTSRTVSAGTQQNYTYSYDRYGNRLTQTPLETGYSFVATVNPANNRITNSGFTYDAAGNMTSDSVHSYTYDADGNIISVDSGSTGVYVYDAFNRRIQSRTQSGTLDYLYDYAGRRISSWTSGTVANEGRIYWDGSQFAFRPLDGTTYFDHQDTLGTERMRTNYAGGVGSTYTSLPWGDGYTAAVNNSGGDQDNEHYAGLEHDAESGTEHAQFRNYASAQGRWLSPDPYLGSHRLSNPQSFNRYAYALNNPMSFIDPAGLEDEQGCGSDDDGCGGDGGGGGGGGAGDGGGDSGYGSAGAGDNPVNPGDPFIISMKIFDFQPDSNPFGYYIGLANYPTTTLTALLGAGIAPNNPQQPQKPKCDPLTRLGGAIKALSAAGDAAGSFNLAWVHVAAAGFLIGAGCLEPTPFEPATCVASGFGGVALLGGATVLTNLGTHQVENEVIPGIKQAVTCTPEGE